MYSVQRTMKTLVYHSEIAVPMLGTLTVHSGANATATVTA